VPALLAEEFLGKQTPDAGLTQALADLRIANVLPAHHRGGPSKNGGELLGRTQAGRIFLPVAFLGEHLEAADANHEELVEVGARDCEKLQPFQNRQRFVKSALQDPVVEFEPG